MERALLLQPTTEEAQALGVPAAPIPWTLALLQAPDAEGGSADAVLPARPVGYRPDAAAPEGHRPDPDLARVPLRHLLCVYRL